MPRVYDPQRGWVDAPTPAAGSAPGGLLLSGSTYVRNPQGDQTVQGRLTGLLNQPNDFVRLNEREGQRYAASRGLTNSTLAAQAGRQAAIQAALPIATADAQFANQAAAQNQQALNEMQALELQRQAATAASMSANTGTQFNMLDTEIDHNRRIALMREQNRLDREASREDRDWRTGESRADRELTREGWRWDSDEAGRERDWRSSEAGLDRGLTREGWANERDNAREERAWLRDNMNQEQRYGMFRDILGMMGGTLFSDPSFWRDPAGASGFLSFFGDEFMGLFSRFFGGGNYAPGGG